MCERKTWRSSPYSYTSPMTGRARVPKEFHVAKGRKIYGECICITGPARQGKTLTAVKIIDDLLRLWWNIDKVISNIHLDLSSIGMQDKFEFFSDVDQLKGVPEKGMRRVVFIDEMRRLTDSRMSTGQKNRLISNLFSDVYKQRTDLFYTDQDAWAVDKRVRLNVNYVIRPFMRGDWCINYDFDSLNSYRNFFDYGLGGPWQKPYGFWGPAYYPLFDTEYHVEDFHMKFHPEKFVDEFTSWRKDKDYFDVKLDRDLIYYWNKTEAVGLEPSEISAFFTHLKLNGQAP